jgi:hypothetical protein
MTLLEVLLLYREKAYTSSCRVLASGMPLRDVHKMAKSHYKVMKRILGRQDPRLQILVERIYRRALADALARN